MRHAAARLLVESGPAGVTHRKVAAAAGVPLGSANYHFPTSHALIAAAVEAAEEQRLRAATLVAQQVTRRQRDSRQTAAVLLNVWFAPQVDADVVRARLRPRIDALHDPSLRAVAHAVRPRLLQALSTALERCGHGAFDDVDLIAVVLDSVLLYANGIGSSDDREFAIDMLARVLDLSEHQQPGTVAR
jgi:DNA-binding transcriptional regulator YbjK